jgi:hypothetical protein
MNGIHGLMGFRIILYNAGKRWRKARLGRCVLEGTNTCEAKREKAQMDGRTDCDHVGAHRIGIEPDTVGADVRSEVGENDERGAHRACHGSALLQIRGNQADLIRAIVQQEPDIVLLGGDIFDDILPNDSRRSSCLRELPTYIPATMSPGITNIGAETSAEFWNWFVIRREDFKRDV